jgi:hypothetical protein
VPVRALWSIQCVLMVSLAAAHGTTSSPTSAASAAQGKYQLYRAQAAQILTDRGDAGSLAAAAALTFLTATNHGRPEPSPQKTTAVELAVRAGELDPTNQPIGWLHLQLCAATVGCDIRDAATTMRWVDADNSAAWMPTLAIAQKDRDATEIDRVLADMAQGVRFDLYWNRTVVLLYDALKAADTGLPPQYIPSDLTRLGEALSVAAAEIIPPFTPIYAACRENGAAERRENCLKLAKLMQRGDTIIAQMAGFNLERHLLPQDSKEARVIQERKRVLEWRASSASRFDEPLLPWLRNARARRRVAEMRAMAREEDVDLAILRERKRPLEPPEEKK